MAANAHRCAIKLNILTKLQRRNEDEKSFSDIVFLTNSLFDTVDFLQKENLRLRIQNEKLEHNSIHVQTRRDSSSSPSSEQISLLEKKIYLLQEELTEVHRRKGEFAQQIIDLRNALDLREKEMVAKCAELQEVERALLVSEEICKQYKQKNSEALLNLQSMKDEYDALLLSYSSLEEKKNQLDKEHQNLICEWMTFKARDADRLNAETEQIQKLKQAKLQKDLEEAAREPVILDSRRLRNALCIEAAIPRKMVTKFDSHDGEVNAAAWFSSGTKLVTGGGDRKVKLWEISHGSQPILKGVAHESNSSVMSVDFDFEETFVIGSSCDFASRVWTVNDLKIRHTLTGHSGKVMAAKFLGESSKVVSGSHDRTLKIWDLRRRACIRTIFAGSSCNDIVTCIGNDSTVVSGHFDKRIRFWDSRTDTSKNEILLQGKITSLDISRDGFSLLSCARDDSLKLIDFRMNRVVRTFSSDGFVVGCDWTRARFSPDLQYCVAGSQDGSIFIWVISSGKVEKILKEHNSTVTTCSWSSDGRLLISCDKNKKSIIWANV